MDAKHVQVIGIKIYTKDGKTNHIVDYMKPYSDYDVENADRCSGFATGQFFTRDQSAASLIPGDIIRPYYTVGFGGKAMFDGFEMIKPAKEK